MFMVNQYPMENRNHTATMEALSYSKPLYKQFYLFRLISFNTQSNCRANFQKEISCQ